MGESAHQDSEAARVRDEREAWEADSVYARQDRMRERLSHVFEAPNTRRAEAAFDAQAFRLADGARVLEIGCSDGQFTARLRASGARYVLGVDLAETEVARAQLGAVPGEMEFRVHDANGPIEGTFDLIIGRAVMHHLRWKPVLDRLYETNLAPGGSMQFWEPMGSNPLLRLYHRYATRLHTEEETPFYRGDLRWIRNRFDHVQLRPVNLFSLPVGVMSSLLVPRAGSDNALMRAADRLDTWLQRRLPVLGPWYRIAMLTIHKPASIHEFDSGPAEQGTRARDAA